jgi:hypothetical protein
MALIQFTMCAMMRLNIFCALTGVALASIGKISVSNYCDIDYFLWSVSNIQSDMQHLRPGGTWSETYRTNPNGGGVSVKLSKVETPVNISQVEYTLDTTDARIWYDLSNIDSVQQIPVTNGIRITPHYSGALPQSSPHLSNCVTVYCPPNITFCEGIYNRWNDDHATHTCPLPTDLVVELCPPWQGRRSRIQR